MSEKLTTVLFDGITKEQSVVILTQEELDSLEILKEKQDLEFSQVLAKVTARQSALEKLLGLGLTEEEIAAL